MNFVGPPACNNCCKECEFVSGFGTLTSDWLQTTWSNSSTDVDFYQIPYSVRVALNNRSETRIVASGAMYRLSGAATCVTLHVNLFVGEEEATPSTEVGLFIGGIGRLYIQNGIYKFSECDDEGKYNGGQSGELDEYRYGDGCIIRAEAIGPSQTSVSFWSSPGESGAAHPCAKRITVAQAFDGSRCGVFADEGGEWSNFTLLCGCKCPPEDPDAPVERDCDTYGDTVRGNVGTCFESGGTCEEAADVYHLRPSIIGIRLEHVRGTDTWTGRNRYGDDVVMDIAAGTIVNWEPVTNITSPITFSSFNCLTPTPAWSHIKRRGDPELGRDGTCQCPTKLVPFQWCIVPERGTISRCGHPHTGFGILPGCRICSVASGGTVPNDLTMTIDSGGVEPPDDTDGSSEAQMARWLLRVVGTHTLTYEQARDPLRPQCRWDKQIPGGEGFNDIVLEADLYFGARFNIDVYPIAYQGLPRRMSVIYSAPEYDCDGGGTTFDKTQEEYGDPPISYPTNVWPDTLTLSGELGEYISGV